MALRLLVVLGVSAMASLPIAHSSPPHPTGFGSESARTTIAQGQTPSQAGWKFQLISKKVSEKKPTRERGGHDNGGRQAWNSNVHKGKKGRQGRTNQSWSGFRTPKKRIQRESSRRQEYRRPARTIHPQRARALPNPTRKQPILKPNPTAVPQTSVRKNKPPSEEFHSEFRLADSENEYEDNFGPDPGYSGPEISDNEALELQLGLGAGEQLEEEDEDEKEPDYPAPPPEDSDIGSSPESIVDHSSSPPISSAPDPTIHTEPDIFESNTDDSSSSSSDSSAGDSKKSTKASGKSTPKKGAVSKGNDSLNTETILSDEPLKFEDKITTKKKRKKWGGGSGSDSADKTQTWGGKSSEKTKVPTHWQDVTNIPDPNNSGHKPSIWNPYDPDRTGQKTGDLSIYENAPKGSYGDYDSATGASAEEGGHAVGIGINLPGAHDKQRGRSTRVNRNPKSNKRRPSTGASNSNTYDESHASNDALPTSNRKGTTGSADRAHPTESRIKRIKKLSRQHDTQPSKGFRRASQGPSPVISEPDAIAISHLAYDGKVGNTIVDSAGEKMSVVEVREDKNTGFRAVIMESDDGKAVIGFAGTAFPQETKNSKGPYSELRGPSTYKSINVSDATTDFEQVVASPKSETISYWSGRTMLSGGVPKQYQQAVELTTEMQAKYGDNLQLTGHSLGGGLANYASSINNVGGVGINSAPLGRAAQSNIRNSSTSRGTQQFEHFNNENELATKFSPGKQLGVIHTHKNPSDAEGVVAGHSLKNVHPSQAVISTKRSSLKTDAD